MTTPRDTWALTPAEEEFFRAGEQLEAMQPSSELDTDETTRPSFWQRLRRKSAR